MVIFSLVVCFILFAVGAPIYIAFSACGLIILFFHAGFSISQFASIYFDTIDSFVLVAAPLFILAGNLMVHGGISKPLLSLFSSFTNRIAGGLAIASIIASAFVGAITAVSLATLAMVGLVMVPAMIEAKYDKDYIGGVLCCASSLGSLVPPSLTFILFGFLVQQSVGKLFIAGIIPAIIVMVVLCITALFIGKRRQFPLTPDISWHERGRLFYKSLPAIGMPLIILGGIYSGIFSPTEAAAVACVYSLLIGCCIYKQITWQTIWTALTETAKLSGIVLAIVASGILVGKAFILAGFAGSMAEWVVAAGLSRIWFLILIMVWFFLLGTFIDGVPLMFIIMPIIWPSVIALNINPLHLGVIFCISVQIAAITPPLAPAIFFTSSLFDIPSEKVTIGALPFLAVLVLVLIIITVFPEISTWLPGYMIR